MRKTSDKKNGLPRLGDETSGNLFRIIDQADHGNDRGRVNGALPMLIVETDVSSHHRNVEERTGVGQTLHAFLEHMIGLGLVRVGEVQVVGYRQGPSSRASQVRIHSAKAIWAPL